MTIKLINLSGRKFNHLYVNKLLKTVKNSDGNVYAYSWESRCDFCGKIIDVLDKELKNGRKQHCGCVL